MPARRRRLTRRVVRSAQLPPGAPASGSSERTNPGRALNGCANLRDMIESLAAGFVLDRRWHWLRGEMDRSKEPDPAALVTLFSSLRVPYAVIGGVALQIHQKEPRTTIGIEIAVPDRGGLPREALTAAGFRETGRHGHSDN